jgi:hypothetical protein
MDNPYFFKAEQAVEKTAGSVFCIFFTFGHSAKVCPSVFLWR